MRKGEFQRTTGGGGWSLEEGNKWNIWDGVRMNSPFNELKSTVEMMCKC